MKLTNRDSLPRGLVRAIEEDPYDNAGSDVTASSLGDPPLLLALKRKYHDQLEEDAADRIWSLLGQAVHVIADRGAQKTEGVLSEQRLFMDVLGWRVSGAFDHYNLEDGTLTDLKITSAWTVIYGDRIPDWEAQTNTLAHLLELHGHKVNALEIVAILRDFAPREVDRVKNYPKTNVAVIPLKLWTPEKRQAYIEERVRLHQKARELPDDQITPCTDEERWAKRDKKTGAVTYVRCGTPEKRGYCPCAPVCPVLKREREGGPHERR